MSTVSRIQTLTKKTFTYRKSGVFLFWLAIIAAYWLYAYRNDLSALETLRRLWGLFQIPFWGPLIYLLFFSIQPLVFFPSALMGVIGGHLFGPWWGVLITMGGALGAASVTYGTGYFFGIDPDNPRFARLQRFRSRLEKHTFEALVTLHLLYMPYDLVNYFAGLLRLPWRPFLLSTLVGSIPGIFTFVFFGASLDMSELDQGVQFDDRMILLTVVTLVISLTLGRIVRKRTSGGER